MAKKSLVIVESPSKSKTIKKYLGKDYDVVASMGHVIDLPKSKLGVDVDDDFKPSYITMKGKAKIIKEIKDKAKKADNIYLATDPDREGEAIAWHLKNALDIDDKEKCRITFNEITKTAVIDAVKKARVLDMDLINAQQARRILDRIVGYKLSPLLWKKIKKGLSAGRVQSVALRIIIDRENEIKSFIPKEYWTLIALLRQSKTEKAVIARFYGDGKKKIELTNGEQVKEIVNKIDKKDFKVIDIKKSERKRNPSPPFTTSTLQQEASRKIGYTIKKTMMLAQSLYEAGYITYMRTDSTRLSSEALGMAKGYISSVYGENYYQYRVFKQKKDAQDAHEAIRPSNASNSFDEIKADTSSDAVKLYKLILNRFLASQMAQAVYDSTTVTFDVESYIFKANGLEVKFDGFMVLYSEGKDDKQKREDEIDEEDDTDRILPPMVVGEMIKQEKLDFKQKFTEPPSRYTEASLVKVLEEKGIGRPSTYAPTISTILDRNYIEKDAKYLVPTNLGDIVNTMMLQNFENIVDITFTADMENKLDEVAEGKQDYIKMLKDFYFPFIKHLEEVEETIEHVKIQDEVTEVICELCGSNMVIKQGRFGKFLACPKYPECKNTKPIVQEIDVPCPKCGSKILLKKSKKGRKFFVCENSPETCDYISWNKPSKNKAENEGEEANIEKVVKRKTTTTKKATSKVATKTTKPASKVKKTTAKKTTTKKKDNK